jgi:hypothetical protein
MNQHHQTSEQLGGRHTFTLLRRGARRQGRTSRAGRAVQPGTCQGGRRDAAWPLAGGPETCDW